MKATGKNKKRNKRKDDSKVRSQASNITIAGAITYPFPNIPRELIDTNDTLRVKGICPNSILVELKFNDFFLERTNVGAVTGSWRYRMNSVFDPDPIIGSGAVSGFAQWAAFYSTYRVLGFGYNIITTNGEAFPVQVTTVPSETDLGSNYSGSAEFPEGKFASSRMLSAKGGQDRATISGYINLENYMGKSYLFDPAFNAGVTTNPAALLYLNMGINGGANVFTTIGITSQVLLTYHVLLYRRISLFI